MAAVIPEIWIFSMLDRVGRIEVPTIVAARVSIPPEPFKLSALDKVAEPFALSEPSK